MTVKEFFESRHGQEIFLVSKVSRSPVSAHPAFYSNGRGDSSPAGKTTGVWSSILTPPHIIPNLRMSRAIPPLHRGDFTVILPVQGSVWEFKNLSSLHLYRLTAKTEVNSKFSNNHQCCLSRLVRISQSVSHWHYYYYYYCCCCCGC